MELIKNNQICLQFKGKYDILYNKVYYVSNFDYVTNKFRPAYDMIEFMRLECYMRVDSFVIDGGKRLEGEIAVQGAKNAVLPILAATVLNGGKNVIHNCPCLRDVKKTVMVLESLGCLVDVQNHTVTVDSSTMNDCRIDESLMRQMRSSIVFLGAVIGRWGEAIVSMPGGCEIGARPIDLHLKALKKLGVDISEAHGYIYCKASKLEGCDIHLDFPSVGATENIMLAASCAKGVTVISNAAREPEIVDLQSFLNRMGAKVSGAGESLIKIEGVEKLYGVDHTIMPDRIAAATYMAAAAVTGGEVLLKNAQPDDMLSVLSAFSEMGCSVTTAENKIALTSLKRPKRFLNIRTMVHPGFPTDAGPIFVALATVAEGTSVFVENIFENRYNYIGELRRLGANIKVADRVAVIEGKGELSGALVRSTDLRGGAALVLAGLKAGGSTVIDNVHYIDRGYDNIEGNLRCLGADIKRI